MPEISFDSFSFTTVQETLDELSSQVSVFDESEKKICQWCRSGFVPDRRGNCLACGGPPRGRLPRRRINHVGNDKIIVSELLPVLDFCEEDYA